MSHYAGCIFLFVEIKKSFNRKIQKVVTRKNPDPASVTWIEPKVLKRQAREAAEAEAAAKAAQEGEGNE